MTMDLTKIWIYHITDVGNLPNILAAGGLHSEATLQTAGAHPTVKHYALGYVPRC